MTWPSAYPGWPSADDGVVNILCGLSHCGGSGSSPAWSGWDGIGSTNRCMALQGLPENGYDVVDSDPSIPYIISTCAGEIIEESTAECPGGLLGGSCGPDEVRLLPTWTGVTQNFSGTCACQPAARHAVAFRSGNGVNFLTADGGGGSTFRADASQLGPSETFYLVDINGGFLEHNDLIDIRTWRADRTVANFVGALSPAGSNPVASYTSATTSVTPSPLTQWRIKRVAGAGRVVNGDAVALFNLGRARFLTAANAGGSTLTTDQTFIGAWEQFTYVEPRAALLANIRVSNGMYAQYNGVAPALTTDWLFGEYDFSAHAQSEARQQSFWVVDHNGGALQHNDIVSFEWSLGPTHWSTCSSGTGAVRGNATFVSQTCQQFRVELSAGACSARLSSATCISQRGCTWSGSACSGTAILEHKDAVRLFSIGQSRYLRQSGAAILADQLVGTSAAAQFRLDFAQGRDDCRGFAAACGAFTQGSNCVNQQGCSWSGSVCTGTPAACSAFSAAPNCANQKGCTWNPTARFEVY